MQTARYVMNTLSFLHPSIMFPATRAKVILARTENSANVIPRCFKNKTKIILETAMEDAVFEFKKKNREDDEIRLITSGRLLPNKNILTAVRSLKYVNNKQKVSLSIVGSGYQKKEILKEVEKNGWKDCVKIYDELPRQKVLELLEHSDIFLFPSLREGGSWSLMEAMAISLPVICLNWAGMAVTTDDLCAIRLPVTNPQQMPKDMATAIIKLIENPELRKRMGDAGRKRIKEVFNWEAKGLFMERLFAELNSKR